MNQYLKKIGLSLVLMLLCLNALAAPKSVQLSYELKRNGHLFANVTESFKQDGKRYSIESVTNGIGIYALLGQRTLTSQGLVTKRGLQPIHFESLQSKKTSKALISDFDWEHHVLNMMIKGTPKQESLPLGTQDLLSVMYQFMFMPPKANKLDLNIAIGKKLSKQQYTVTAAKSLNTKAGNFKAISLIDYQDGESSKIIYFAQDRQYVPVKIEFVDDGAKYEQIITKIAIDENSN
jgi:hypothetical protein